MKMRKMWEKEDKKREILKRFGAKVKKKSKKKRKKLEEKWVKIEGVEVGDYGGFTENERV